MNNARFLMIVMAISLGAGLLFMVQPLAGKFLLPVLGGGPSVWNTAMVFFQLLLLLGYYLAHVSGRLNLKAQLLLPLILLGAGLLISLPINVPLDILGKPDVTKPVMWQFMALLLMAGLPFLALSMLSPLLQRWFALSYPDRNPYALYRASNIGSFLGLVCYPFVVEPLLPLSGQSSFWAVGYGVLMLILAGIALKLWQLPAPIAKQGEITDADKPTWPQYGLWLFLSFIPSALLLGVTAYITTDVASLPLFWIIPLALYLLSFVLGFSDKMIGWLPIIRAIQLVSLLAMLWVSASDVYVSQKHLVALHLFLFSTNALACHMLLYRLRPATAHLTRFYLTTSFGGALGGVCISLIAPLIFPLPFEYALAIALCALTILIKLKDNNTAALPLPYKRLGIAIGAGLLLWFSAELEAPFVRLVIAIAMVSSIGALLAYPRMLTALLLVGFAFFPLYSWGLLKGTDAVHRSYFGVLRAYESDGVRVLTNGTTLHGQQVIKSPFNRLALSYYSRYSPFADVMNVMDERPEGEQRIAGLGLGVGSIACYPRAGRHFTFFDIDPEVVKLAQDPKFFTYLSDCGSPYDIKLGDARLTLADEPDGSYDVILVDVFSSDSIPVHMMTLEALDLYMAKLKPFGVVLFHTSNRHFALKAEVARLAQARGLAVMKRNSKDGKIVGPVSAAETQYVVIARTSAVLEPLKEMADGWLPLPVYDGRPWSDDYVNILRAIGTPREIGE